MAPEIIKRENYNEKVDIWAIGVLAFKLLTGNIPFNGKSNIEIKNQILKAKINWKHPEIKKVDAKAIDFIKKAMTYNQIERSSAMQLLSHPWIVKYNLQNQVQVDDESMFKILKNLINFSKATKFQKTVTSILMGLKAEKTDLKELKHAFYQIDKNQDGTLSRNELTQIGEHIE